MARIVEDAVRGGGCRPVRSLISLSDTASSRVGQLVDQREHAFQDLDAGLGGGRVIVFFHEAEWSFGIRSF